MGLDTTFHKYKCDDDVNVSFRNDYYLIHALYNVYKEYLKGNYEYCSHLIINDYIIKDVIKYLKDNIEDDPEEISNTIERIETEILPLFNKLEWPDKMITTTV